MVYLKRSKDEREPQRVERGDAALDVMDRFLDGRTWLVGDAMTVADIALLAYTGLADEGGFDLAPRKNVTAWIGRCEQGLEQPRD